MKNILIISKLLLFILLISCENPKSPTKDSNPLFGEIKRVGGGNSVGINPIKFTEFSETLYTSDNIEGEASWFYLSYNVPDVVGEWEFSFTDFHSINEINNIDTFNFYGNRNTGELVFRFPERFPVPSIDGIIRAVVIRKGEVFLARIVSSDSPIIAFKFKEQIPLCSV